MCNSTSSNFFSFFPGRYCTNNKNKRLFKAHTAAMDYLELMSLTAIFYAIWAVVLSDSLFHRVWSCALLSLRYLASVLYYQTTLPLTILTFADLALCISLSPLQLLFHSKADNPNHQALDIFFPRNNSLGNGDNPEESIFMEFVLSLLSSHVRITDFNLSCVEYCCCPWSRINSN